MRVYLWTSSRMSSTPSSGRPSVSRGASSDIASCHIATALQIACPALSVPKISFTRHNEAFIPPRPGAGCILRLSVIVFRYLGDDAKCELLRKALFPTSVRQNPDVIPQRASQSSPARSHFMHKGVAFRLHRLPPPPGIKHDERNRAGRLGDVAKASAALYRDGERQPERKSTIRLSGVLTFAILFMPFFLC